MLVRDVLVSALISCTGDDRSVTDDVDRVNTMS